MIIVDPVSHEIVHRGAYDTHGRAEDNETLMQALKTAEEDFHIVVMVAVDEAASQLNDDTVKIVKQFGSTQLEKLDFR